MLRNVSQHNKDDTLYACDARFVLHNGQVCGLTCLPAEDNSCSMRLSSGPDTGIDELCPAVTTDLYVNIPEIQFNH